MNRPSLVRALWASAAIAAALALTGCNNPAEETPWTGGRHLQPLSERLLSDIENKNMAKESPILVRIFKEEAEFEVWKADKTGRFALLRTYPICRWSGELGPKIKEGDRQAPEGFYTITPALMNPNSQYYLAINTGFPNAYDRANGRSGEFLMIHGDCSSRGCYAMTDEQIAEIYSLARESFFGGQKAFQIQAYPFRMTPLNMAKHRNSPHMAFWKMLKEGYDHFEVMRLEPKVDVCEKRYVFDAQSKGRFSPADKCPAYTVQQELVSAVRDKERRDDAQIADLVSRGTATVPVKMGVDGGMNDTFLSAVKSHGGLGADIKTASGTIPAHVNPPGQPRDATGSTMSLASSDSRPASVQVASAGANSGGIASFFGNLFGSKREDETRAAQSTPSAPAKTKVASTSTKQTTSAAAARTKSETQSADAKPPKVAMAKPASTPREESGSDAEAKPASAPSLLSGAAPAVPSGGFDGRFGAWR